MKKGYIMAGKIDRMALIMLINAVLIHGIASGKVEVGPYVQFTGTYTAVVRWDTDKASSSIVQYGKTTSLGSTVSDSASTTTHEVAISDLELRTKYYYRISDGEGGFTEMYWPSPEWGFDTDINFSVTNCSDAVSPYPVDSLTSAYESAADRIIAQTGIKKGYCLVYGCGEGRLAFELAKRSELIIIGVDADETKIAAARKKLRKAGIYGARVTIRHLSSTETLSNMPFTKYFANLIVSDYMISEGDCLGTAEEMFRVLRPSGGIAYLGQPGGANNLTGAELQTWLNELFDPADYTITDDPSEAGVWAQVVRGELSGTGWWSHQYGGAHNSGNSYDDIGGADQTSDLQIQWIGRPGANSGIDRHCRMPAPVACNGKLYHQGLNRIMAMDSYNGAMLWSLEIPQLRRVNMPRDASNVCADDDAVYVAVKDNCWRLDGSTGLRTVTHKLNDPGYDWGCVFRYANKLYGSAVKEGSSYRNYRYLGPAEPGWGWYDGYTYGAGGRDWGPATHKISSDYLFANDPDSGSRIWTYNNTAENGTIINTTIAIGGVGDGRIYFIECRDATARAASPARLGDVLWDSGKLYLVALDADDGSKLWDTRITGVGASPAAGIIDGDVVFYLLYANDTLILECSDVTAADNGNYHLYSYDAANGNYKWHKSNGWLGFHHGEHMQRAIVVGDAVYLKPKAYYLSDGSEKLNSGVPNNSCGTLSGTNNALLGRTEGIGMWGVNTGVNSDWLGIRPGCWVNIISGGNMVLIPEAAGGCSCNAYFNTSVGFVPTGN